MNVLEKLDARIKRLRQEPLGFRPAQDDECALLEQCAARIRELESIAAQDKAWKNV